MKKILVIVLIYNLFAMVANAQEGDHVNGGIFSKNFEYNLTRNELGYNFNSKGDVEKRFFGDFNAEKFHKKISSLILNFKARDTLPIVFKGYKIISRTIQVIEDGNTVTFRTVVDDEVWSLKIHEPRGTALKMTNLCLQIIEETKMNNIFNEAKYSDSLDNF